MSDDRTWDEIRALNQAPGYVKFCDLKPGLTLHKVIDDNAHDLHEEDDERECTVHGVINIPISVMGSEPEDEPYYVVRFKETGRVVAVSACHEEAWGWKV